jgi:hypothetical protein
MPTSDPSNLDPASLQRTRAWVNRHPWFVISSSIVVLLLCLYYLFAQNRYHPISDTFPNPSHTKIYVMDLSTGKVTVTMDEPSELGPNSQIVRPIVFSCGSCKDEKQRFVGYYESLTPEAKQAIKNMMNQASTAPDSMPASMPSTQPVGDPIMVGRQIMDPDTKDWIPMESPAAGKLIQDMMSKCGKGKYPTQCFPDLDGDGYEDLPPPMIN